MTTRRSFSPAGPINVRADDAFAQRNVAIPHPNRWRARRQQFRPAERRDSAPLFCRGLRVFSVNSGIVPLTWSFLTIRFVSVADANL